jgi:hypothetical protein
MPVYSKPHQHEMAVAVVEEIARKHGISDVVPHADGAHFTAEGTLDGRRLVSYVRNRMGSNVKRASYKDWGVPVAKIKEFEDHFKGGSHDLIIVHILKDGIYLTRWDEETELASRAGQMTRHDRPNDAAATEPARFIPKDLLIDTDVTMDDVWTGALAKTCFKPENWERILNSVEIRVVEPPGIFTLVSAVTGDERGAALALGLDSDDVPQYQKDLAVTCRHCEMWIYPEEADCPCCGASMTVKEVA